MNNFSLLLQHLCSTLYLQKWFGGRGRDPKATRLFLQCWGVNAPFTEAEQDSHIPSKSSSDRDTSVESALEFKQNLWFKPRAQMKHSSLPGPSWSRQRGPSAQAGLCHCRTKCYLQAPQGEGIHKQPHPGAESATVMKMKVIVNCVNARVILSANRTEGTQTLLW